MPIELESRLRFARQSRVLGAASQARIEALEVELPDDPEVADVAARYLAGAGVAALRVPSSDDATSVGAAAKAIRAAVRVEPASGERRAHAPQLAVAGLPPAVAAYVGGALFAIRTLRDASQEPTGG
jgi:hypothetical protein